MTCKDCMWCDVCKSRVMQFGYDFDENKDVPNFGCGVVAGGFKNKADFVEVVRCKDCEHYVAEYCTRDIKGRTNMFYMKPDDFCSYGERR